MREISMALANRYVTNDDQRLERVLDDGCGTGAMVSILSTLGPSVGIDASSEAIAFAKTTPGRRLVRGDVCKLPFASEAFSLVTSFDVLYHLNVRSDVEALVEITRVLHPGGHLILRLPAFEWLRSRHDAAVQTRQRYSKREVQAKLERAGLTPVFVSFANCLLFPAAVARRLVERFLPDDGTGSEVRPIAAPLNELMYRILRWESHLIRYVSLPFGLSIVAVARKDENR